MPEVTVTLPNLYPMQRRVMADARRFNVLVCGRRWGKTELVKEVLINPALDGFPAGYFAPGYKFVLEVWASLLRTLAPVVSRRDFGQKRIELVTGGVIEMWTMDDPDAGRSRKYKAAVIDEAGLVPNLMTIFQEAIRPTLMDMNGSAWFPGTPKGLNDFYRLYERAGERADWMRWQRPTHDNPYINPAELEAARQDMTEARYQQEILAQFLEDGAGVFKHVQRAVWGGMMSYAETVEYAQSHPVVVGVDLGKVNDFTVFAVGCSETRRLLYYERSQQDYLAQYPRFRTLCHEMRAQTVVIETNIEKTFTEMAYRDALPVLPFNTNATTKQPLIEGLALAFEREQISIPNHPVLIAELMAYEGQRQRSGVMSYGAPDGMHDDTVIATALAWHAMNGNNRMEIWADNPLFG